MIDFEDQVAVVTGAGRGLGRLYAIELARRGAAVVVNDLGTTTTGDGPDQRVADEVVAAIRGAGGRAVASHDSVDRPESATAIVECALDEFGRLDAVVSNAGIFHTAPFEEITADEWVRMRRVHLDGAFYLAQRAFRAMKDDGGRFVFIASSAGMFGQDDSAHYAAAKAGVVGLANVVALEGAGHGIRANCVLPFGQSRMVFETVGTHDLDTIEPTSGFLHAIRAELIVPVVVFLANRACELTHHTISAGAGRYARVFVGLGDGWVAATGSDPTVEDIAAHLDEVVTPDPYRIPMSIYDEIARICEQTGIG